MITIVILVSIMMRKMTIIFMMLKRRWRKNHDNDDMHLHNIIDISLDGEKRKESLLC